MSISWALFPLAMQVVYTSSAVLPLLRLLKAKRSDQHALLNQWLTLVAHGAMLAWSSLYAGEVGLVYGLVVGIATTLLTASTILYYRRFPGGRARAARTPAWRRMRRGRGPSVA